MLNEDELGEALRESLQVLVRDVEPSVALWNWVNAQTPDDRPTTRSHLPMHLPAGRRVLAIAVLLIAMVVATGVIILARSSVTPSYAVTLNAGGAVEITMRDVAAVADANAELRALGVHSIVIVPMTDACSSKVSVTYIAGGGGSDGKSPPTVRLVPKGIPHGTTVIVAAQQLTPNTVEEALGRVVGPPPPCVAVGSSGVGLGPFAKSSIQRHAGKSGRH